MFRKKLLTLCLLAFVGCASDGEIRGTYVNHVRYDHIRCQQLSVKILIHEKKVKEAGQHLKSEANLGYYKELLGELNAMRKSYEGRCQA